MQLHNVQRMVN